MRVYFILNLQQHSACVPDENCELQLHPSGTCFSSTVAVPLSVRGPTTYPLLSLTTSETMLMILRKEEISSKSMEN